MIGGGQRSAHRMVLFLGGRTEETVKKSQSSRNFEAQKLIFGPKHEKWTISCSPLLPVHAIDPMPMGDANAAERSEITAIASGGGIF